MNTYGPHGDADDQQTCHRGGDRPVLAQIAVLALPLVIRHLTESTLPKPRLCDAAPVTPSRHYDGASTVRDAGAASFRKIAGDRSGCRPPTNDHRGLAGLEAPTRQRRQDPRPCRSPGASVGRAVPGAHAT